VLHGDVEQGQFAGEDVRGCQGHSPAADVLPDRDAGQRRERAPEVVLARPRAPAQHGDVDRITSFDGVLDEVQRCVEAFHHHRSPSRNTTILEEVGHLNPTATVPDRSSCPRHSPTLKGRHPGNGVAPGRADRPWVGR
jgi:hypothetical protein